MMSVSKTALKTIGSTAYVEIFGVKNIPAKIDTGADTSAVWASDIDMTENGTLIFSLFSPESSFYTGERLKTTDYYAKIVRSSLGDTQVRYRVKIPITIDGASFITSFTLANRSRNHFPVLIGRHTLENRFLVDVSKTCVDYPTSKNSVRLNQELQTDPYRFHQKYFKKGAA